MAGIITLEAVNKYYGQGANRIHVLKDINMPTTMRVIS